MRPNILDQIANRKNIPVSETPGISSSIVDKIAKDRVFTDNNPVELEGSFKENSNISLRDDNTLLNEDLTQGQSTSMWNDLKQAWDATQQSSYQNKVNEAQNILDKSIDIKNSWLKSKRLGLVSDDKVKEEFDKIDSKNSKAAIDLKEAQDGVDTNIQETKNEYVSKLYKLNQALVNAKGANAGFGEAVEYTLANGIGSMGSMMTQQLAATFGKKGIDKIATAAVEGLVGGSETGPGALAVSAITALSQIGLLWSARYGETQSELGDNVTQAKQKLTEDWFKRYNPNQDPKGPQPSEEDMRQIRMKSMKGTEDLYKENMSLLAMDGVEMVLGSSLFEGSSVFKGLDKLGDYNKYTRAAKALGTGYLEATGEKFEEGLQYAAGQRQNDKALNLDQYQDKGFITNMLTDSKDTLESISYGLPYMGNHNLGGKYAEDSQFQSAAEAGGLLGFIGGGISSGIRIGKDIATYIKTSKDLKESGVANTDEKVFRLKDQLYQKHFDKGTVNFLLEGIRNLKTSKDEKGNALMSESQATEEIKNVVTAFHKYKEVSEHLDNITPKGFLGLAYSPEQRVFTALAKHELFHTTMELVRQNKGVKALESIDNINNLIKHQEKIIQAIEETKDNSLLKKTYNLESRLKIAKNKLIELNKQKTLYLKEGNLTEESMPEVDSIEQSNSNKQYLIDSLNITELKNKYKELLKIKDNKSLEDWGSNRLSSIKKEQEIFKETKNNTQNLEEDHEEETFDIETKKQDLERLRNQELAEIDERSSIVDGQRLESDESAKAKKDIINAKYDKELSALTDKASLDDIMNGAVTPKVTTPNVQVPGEIDETKVQQAIPLLDDVKRKDSTNTTVNGPDDDTKEAESRAYRYYEKVKLAGHRLLVVTRKNNPELFNKILDQDETGKKFEEDYKTGLAEANHYPNQKVTTGIDYTGIYVVLTDSQNNIVLADQSGNDSAEGKMVFSTLETANRIHSKAIRVIDEGKAITELSGLRGKLLNTTSKDVYLSVTGKSKGHAVTLPKVEKTFFDDKGDLVNKTVRASIPVELSFGPIADLKVELPTQASKTMEKASGVKGATVLDTNKQVALTGKLYAFDKNNTAFDLVPRNLNKDEADMVLNLIEQVFHPETAKVADPVKQLEKIISTAVPKTGVTEYTFGFKNKLLIVGKELEVSAETFPQRIGEIRSFLNTVKYVNANVSGIYGTQLEESFVGPTVDDTVPGKEYTTYKEYLLEGEHPMFGTDLAPMGEVQYRNTYLKFSPTLESGEIKAKPTENTDSEGESTEIKTEPTESKPTENKRGNRNLFDTKGDEKIDIKNLDRSTTAVRTSKGKLTDFEKNWFKEKFPNIQVDTVMDLIERKSFGRFLSNGKVLLSDKAINGTLYHEAFHVITQLYLTIDEIKALYDETRNRLSLPNASDKEIEEILAEDFAVYKESGKVLNGATKRNTTFRKILNFLRSLVGLSNDSIKSLYDRIDKGHYTNRKIVGVRQFTSLDSTISGLTVSETKDVYSGMDAYYFDIAFKNAMTPDQALNQKHDIFPFIYKRFVAKEEEAIAKGDERLIKVFGSVLDNFNEIMEGWKERMKSLKVIVEDVSEDKLRNLAEGIEDEFVEDEEERTAEDGIRSGDQYLAAHEVSTRKGMSGASKMLIRSLKVKDKDGNEVENSLGLPQTVDFGSTYNFLLKQTAGLTEYPEIYAKIKEVAERKPEYRDLLDRLGEPSDSYTADKMFFQRKFRQDFSKNLATSFITVVESDGRVLQVDTNKQNTLERVKEKWRANLRLNTKVTDGKLIVTTPKTSDDVAYLQALGIELSPDTILNTVGNKVFAQAVKAVRNYVETNNGDVTDLFDESKDSKIKGNMNDILTLEAEYNNSTIELSILSTTNKTIYPISLNNGLSIIKNLINNAKSLDDLYLDLPHLRYVNSQGSVWLDNMFDSKTGLRIPGTKLELNLADGLKTGTSITDSVANSTKDLSTGDKFVQEINHLLLYGNSSVIRTADKATEHIIGLNTYKNKSKLAVSIDDLKVGANKEITGFKNSEVKKIFRGYFNSEVKRIALFELAGVGKNIDEYSKSGGKFTVFSSFDNFKGIKDDVEAKIASMREFAKTATIADIEKAIDEFTPSLYKDLDNSVNDFFTRYSTELTGKLEKFGVINGFDKNLSDNYTKEELINAVVVNDFINSVEQTKLFYGDMSFYKALFKRTSSLAGTKETCATDKFLNNWLNKDNKRKDGKIADGKIKVAIFEDSTQTKQDLGEYKKALVASGLSESAADKLLGAYKKMDEGDAQGWITLDEAREFKIRLGNWSPAMERLFDKSQSFKKDDPSTHLNPKEIKKLYWLVAKAQYAGPAVGGNLFVPVYHKFSLMPLIPQLVHGTNMSKVLDNMTRQQVGYALFKSGAKIGTPLSPEGIANRFYTEDSKVNGKDVYGTHGEINEGDYNIQTVDYRFLGLQQKSSDPHHTVTFGTQFRKLIFTGAFVNGQEVIPGAKTLFDEYNKTIRRQVEAAKQQLIKELGLDPTNLESKDVTKLVELLRKEAQDRSLADNIIDSLQVAIKEGKKILKYPLDSSVNKAKIDAMMMSLVNSRLVKQKVNGDAYIQGASSGFETIGKRDIGTNKELRFYKQVKDSKGNVTHTSKMEVMIPMSKEYYSLLDKYGSIDALNEAIIGKNISEDLITLVGYRIPTQGMNSIDHMVIRKFLPEQSGQLIILPTEIVAKSGGDYDIDKLNIFRPDFTKEGELADTDHNKIINIASQMLANKANFKALITPNSTSILTDVVDEYDFLVYQKEGGKLDFDAWEKQRDKKAIDYTRQLMMTEKIEEQHSKLMLAKDMIGIGAVSNVFVPLAQAVNASINKVYYLRGVAKMVEIRFPHHLVADKTNPHIKISEAKDTEGENDIQEVNSQIINATVDAANTPGLLAALGMNKDTLSVYSYLNMTGVPFKFIFYMMKQPIIQEYMEKTSINKSAYIGATGGAQAEKIIANNLIDKYQGYLGKNKRMYFPKFSNIDILKKYSTHKDLGLITDPATLTDSEIEFNSLQIQILRDFLRYKGEAMLLSDAIRSVNFDTAGIGENLESIDLKMQDINSVEQTDFVNGLDRIKHETAIGAFDQNVFTLEAYKSFYVTQTPIIKNALRKLATVISPMKNEDKLRLASTLNNDFINFVIQNFGYNKTVDPRSLFTGQNSVARRLARIQSNPGIEQQELADNLIIQELQPIIANEKTTDLRDNVRLYTKRFDSFTANQLTEAFRELKELDPTLYKDIVDLGIIQSGLANSHITYLGIIPYEYYGDLFNDAFENFNKSNTAEAINKFNYLFVGNNAKDSLVYETAQALGVPLLGQGTFGKDYMYTEETRELALDGKDAQRYMEAKAKEEAEEDAFVDSLLDNSQTNTEDNLDKSEENPILDKPDITDELKDENNC